MDFENLKIFYHYGEKAQKQKLKKKLSELIGAVDDSCESFKDKIIDVLNLLEQFIMANGWGEEVYIRQFEEVERQKKRIKNETDKF